MNGDMDSDSSGNACDNCPTVVNPNQLNSDGDMWGNACDNCPYVKNDNQNDYDYDGIGSACDDDWDNDGIKNDLDNCKYEANPDQSNNDGDLYGNVCDNCPDHKNNDQKDSNCNGVGDECDLISATLPFACGGDKMPEAYHRFWDIKTPFDAILWGFEDQLQNQFHMQGQ